MADDSDTPSSQVTYWLDQIEGAQKGCHDWYERGDGVLKRYLDEKPATMQTNAHRMNVLWSNVETIKPALYSKTPNPKVSRRFRDKDPLGKWGAIVLERAEAFELDAYDVDYNIRACIQDYLLPGRGQVWVSYEPKIEAIPGPDGKPTEQLVWECTKDRHLNWKDFLTNPARTWDEVWWGAQRVYLSKDEVKSAEKEGKFAKGISKKLKFEFQKDDNGDKDSGNRTKKAAIWEIWCKPKKEVIFVSKSCPEPLGVREPPIDFEGFFPFPRPLTTTTTTDSIIPTPDYCQYQDQAAEIDLLTQRINLLTQALRVVGLYNAALDAGDGSNPLTTLFTNAQTNQMVPVSNWAMYAQAGGFDGAVDFFPLKDVIDTLSQCYVAREQAKAAMYEITGISDIVRGASKAEETATAQQIKSQWGSLRIKDRQAEVQRFVRDIMRLKSEIRAEHFSPETLKTMSNVPLLTEQEKQQLQMRQQAQAMAQQNPEQAQALLQANPQLQALAQPLTLDETQRLREPTWEAVYQFLKDQKLRSYRIDIETDSTIATDEIAEKQARVEFISAATSFIQAWGPILMQSPKMAPLAGEMLTFAARSFKQAEGLETEIEAMVDMMSQQALLPPQQQPQDPKVQAEQQKMQAQQQSDQQKAQFEDKKRQDESALTGEQHQFERDRMVHERGKMALDAQSMQEDRAFKLQERQMQASAQVDSEKAKRPTPEELGSVLAPIADAMAQFLQQMAQSQQAMQQTMGQAMTAMAEAATRMADAAAAPKQIIVQRDAQQRISGGTATPRMN